MLKELTKSIGPIILLTMSCASAAGRIGCDEESVEFLLSYDFSEIAIGTETKILFTVKPDAGASHVVDERTGHENPLTKGTTLRLGMGESWRFFCMGGVGCYTMTLTNGSCAAKFDNVPEKFKSATSMLLIRQKIGFRDDVDDKMYFQYRNFLVDVKGASCFDVERKRTTLFRFPFHALWNDQKDRVRRFGNRLSDNYICRRRWELAKQEYGEVSNDQKVRDLVAGLPDGGTAVVTLRHEQENGRLQDFLLADVMRKGDGMMVRGTANGGVCRCVMRVFDELGQPKFERHCHGPWQPIMMYEYAETGRLRRSVMLHQGSSRLELYHEGFSTDGEKVEDETELVSFTNEVARLTEGLERVWQALSYDTVLENARNDFNVKITKREEDASDVPRGTRCPQKEDLLRFWNKERHEKGLPDLTHEERAEKLRAWRLARDLGEMATLRCRLNGGAATTDSDEKLDLENVKVLRLVKAIYRYMAMADRTPRNLAEVATYRKWERPVLVAADLESVVDGWGQEYKFEMVRLADGRGHESSEPRIVSAGADGVFGTGDDIDSMVLRERLRRLFPPAQSKLR